MTRKMTNRNRNAAALAAVGTFALVALSGCGEKEKSGDGESAGAGVDSRIEAVLLDSAPEGAISVGEARKSAQPGENVTIAGRVAGTMEPFTEGYAVLVLADDAVETCEQIPGDECPTPWDACCEDPAKLKAMRLTVRVTDENGMPVASSLKGVSGMKELDGLVVTGTVTEDSNAENLVVDATGIFLKSS